MFKVLIADDEEFVRERIKNNMPWQEIGFEVMECVSDGREALDKVRACPPDVILTDILMPNMTGLELAHKLKGEFPEIRVALMSAYDDFNYAKEAIRYGVKGYLLKPVIRDEFMELFQGFAKDIRKEEGQAPRLFFHNEISTFGEGNTYVTRAKQYIANNYSKQIKLKDISERLYVNANYFSSVFKRETGKNFIDYLNEVRINESKKLLLHTDHKVFEISLFVGFGNFSYYNKMFKRMCGVTPQTYRESGGLVYSCKEGSE